MEEFIVEIAKSFGPMAALVAFLVWRDWKSGERLTASLEASQTWIRNTLVELNSATTAALNANTRAMEEFRGVADRCAKRGAER